MQLYPADLPWSLSLDSYEVRSLSIGAVLYATNALMKSLLLLLLFVNLLFLVNQST